MALERVQNVFKPSDKKMKQEVRKNVRQVQREVRNLERDMRKNEGEERKMLSTIRQEAQKGNTDKVKQIARQLVRVRQHNSKLSTMIGSLQDVKFQLTSMSSMQAQTTAMKNVTKMMKKMNSRVSPEKFAKIMQKFAYEKERADLQQEIMSDVMDTGDEEMEDEIVDGVLAEVGLQQLDGLGIVPIEAPADGERVTDGAPARVAVGEGEGEGGKDDEEVDDMEARLRDLQKGL